MKQYVAFSGGKDSTAMLLRMIELGEKIDGVFFADTGEEWGELINYIKEIEKIAGIPIEIIKPPYSLLEGMSKIVTRGKIKGQYRGYPLAFAPCYFMRDAKYIPINEKTKDGVVCIGYASGEENRAKKRENVRTPLIEWGWSEDRCAQYLNDRGILNPLYSNFNRLGCIGCPKQGEASLYVIWKDNSTAWNYIKSLNEKQKELRGEEIMFVDGFFSMIEEKFEKGYIPKKRPKYACVRCEGVTLAFKDQVSLCDY